MTEEETKVLKESQQVIREEAKKVGEAITRILMLGGPKHVEVILLSVLNANRRIMADLKIKTDVDFEEGEG